MHDFGKVVYLDVHKTGSTFISQFLTEHLSLDEVEFRKHGRITDNFKKDAFYFISTRDPLAQYMSLFKYGLDRRGAIYHRFKNLGYLYLYSEENHTITNQQKFDIWLKFMLNPANAAVLADLYKKSIYELIGFQSFRFLMLSFANPGKVLRKCHTKKAVRRNFDKKRIHSAVVRTESLASDLKALAYTSLRPYLINLENAVNFLEDAKAQNESQERHNLNLRDVDPELKKRVIEREWFIYEYLYSNDV